MHPRWWRCWRGWLLLPHWRPRLLRGPPHHRLLRPHQLLGPHWPHWRRSKRWSKRRKRRRLVRPLRHSNAQSGHGILQRCVQTLGRPKNNYLLSGAELVALPVGHGASHAPLELELVWHRPELPKVRSAWRVYRTNLAFLFVDHAVVRHSESRGKDDELTN